MAKSQLSLKRVSQRPEVTAQNAAAAARRWWASDWVLSIGLIAITLALYGQLIGYPFINYDDTVYVTENPQVQAGLSWRTFAWAFTTTEEANWFPLTRLSHALDCQLFGLNAGGHHISSLLIHTINVVLLFLLLQRATGAPARSLIVAALFAVHPFNVQSVAWVAERKNVLSTMFLLLTLAAYARYARSPNWSRYLAVVAMFVCGLLSKPMLVTLPAALLLLDYWPLQRVQGWTTARSPLLLAQSRPSRLCLEKLPLLLLSAGSALVTLIVQRAGGAIQPFPLGIRVETALRGYALYLLKAGWPSSFAFYYPDPFDPGLSQPPSVGDHFLVGLGAALLVIVSLVAWRYRQRHPYLLVGWFWYVGTLVPVIGLVQVGGQGLADRYGYVPLIGIFVALVWCLWDLASAWSIGLRCGTATVALVIFFSIAFVQVRYWRSSVELFSHALRVTRNNFLANDRMANLLYQRKNPEAFRYYAEAARIAPFDPVSHEVMAALLDEEGRYKQAMQSYDVVLKYSADPEALGLAHSNLGVLYGRLGDYAQARAHAQEAMKIAPEKIEAQIRGLTGVYEQNPSVDGYVKLSLLLDGAGRLAEARAACRKAAELSPGRPDVQKLLDHLDQE